VRHFFALLTLLHPGVFRERFGAELVERAVGDVREARVRGMWGTAWTFLTTTLDLISTGILEHIRPSWTAGPKTTNRRKGRMRMGHWIGELRMALRTLSRSPGFTLAAVGTLALALGANAAIYAVADQVVLDPLPFENSDELVYIAASAPGTDFPDEFGVSMEFYLQYSEEADQLESLSTFDSFTATLRLGDRVERARMSRPTPSLFEVLQGEPLLGRLPTADDRDAAVLTHAMWQDWFGGDPDVIGNSLWAMNGPKTVVAVMPPEFRFPDDGPLLWIPREPDPTGEVQVGNFGMDLVGRLAPGATEESLTRQLSVLAERLPERFGGSAAYAGLIEQHVPVVRPLEDEVFSEIAGAVRVLLGAVAVVLLIACANVANLFSVRAETRGRELAVRRALGAGRGTLIRSQMSEAVLVALGAGLAALGTASAALPFFLRWAPESLPGLQTVHLSSLTIGLTLTAAVVAALLCGLVPAIRASSPGMGWLRDGARGSTGRTRWGRNGLVVTQTALALVLLTGSGLLLRSFAELRSVDPGYDTQDIFTFQFAAEQEHLVDGLDWAEFHLGVMDRIRALPGVESVGINENMPLDEGLQQARMVTEASAADPDAAALMNLSFVSPGYFETMGISVLRGRSFERRDVAGGDRAVVSRTAAERLWPGEDAVGRRVRAARGERWYTVVGVVEDILQYDFRQENQPIIYFGMVGPTPTAWAMTSPGYAVRTGRAESIAPEIRALISEIAPEAPMYRAYTMSWLAERSMAELSFTMFILLAAAGLALILGVVGLYGTLSYMVSRRTREIGVRMALGAEASRVRRMVVNQGTRVVVLGVVVGVVVALLSTKALGTLLFGVEAVDPLTFGAVALTMILVGALASYLPARRASAVAPVESLAEG